MDKAELDKIMGLYKSHLQVKKLLTPGTINLYISSIKIFVTELEQVIRIRTGEAGEKAL